MISTKTTFVIVLIGILASCQNAEGDRHGPAGGHASSEEDNDRDCEIEDGTQTAQVDYYNPDTGYSASYSLNVEVENCQVVQIDFNNGGYLDEDHFEPGDIDENGDASIEDDRGRTFEVHIEK